MTKAHMRYVLDIITAYKAGRVIYEASTDGAYTVTTNIQYDGLVSCKYTLRVADYNINLKAQLPRIRHVATGRTTGAFLYSDGVLKTTTGNEISMVELQNFYTTEDGEPLDVTQSRLIINGEVFND